MTNRTDLKKIREVLFANTSDIVDDNWDGEESDSDSDFRISSNESDDTSADEYISEESNLSDSDADEHDALVNAQPRSIEKRGISWCMEPSMGQGRTRASNILKTRPGSTTKVQTILEAFKLFFTDEILDEIVLQTNRYAEQYLNLHKRTQQNSNNSKSEANGWKRIDRIELEAFLGLLIRSGINHNNHELLREL
jgi:hypothetical protein